MSSTSTELAVVEQPRQVSLCEGASIPEIGRRLALVKQALQGAMEKGIDYGIIPGCGDKPALLKPGAEKLKTLFQLSFTVKDKTIRDLGEGHREVELTLTFTHLPTGLIMGEGVGSSNTLERRMQRKNCGPHDAYNNCLKIAKKRALVDGILSVTGSSGLLAQDIEEDPELYRNHDHSHSEGQAYNAQPSNGTPHGSAYMNGHGKSSTLEGIVERAWPNDYQGKRYYFAKVNGQQVQTTDDEPGEELLTLVGRTVKLDVESSPKPGKFYLKRLSVEPAVSQEQGKVEIEKIKRAVEATPSAHIVEKNNADEKRSLLEQINAKMRDAHPRLSHAQVLEAAKTCSCADDAQESIHTLSVDNLKTILCNWDPIHTEAQSIKPEAVA